MLDIDGGEDEEGGKGKEGGSVTENDMIFLEKNRKREEKKRKKRKHMSFLKAKSGEYIIDS